MKCCNTALKQKLAIPKKCDKNRQCLPPLWGITSSCRSSALLCALVTDDQSTGMVPSQGIVQQVTWRVSVALWEAGEGTGADCPPAACAQLQSTQCGACKVPASPDLSLVLESSPKGGISGAGDCSWSSYFCSFWLLPGGCRLLLGCKRHEHPSVRMFCIVFC